MSATTARVGRRASGSLLVRGALRTGEGRTGTVLVGLILMVAFIGPLFSSYSPSELVGAPLQEPSGSFPLGTDLLGRDVLSRFLHGGRSLVLVVAVATLLGYLGGVSIGLLAGFRRGALDLATVGAADLLIAFPPIILILMLVAALGPGLAVATVAIAAVQLPRVVRIVRSVTLDVATREFVEAALARGEPVRTVLRKDVLPNIWSPVLADLGIRLTVSVILFSSLSYLGFGPAPPAADWGLMISENRIGVLDQPWPILVPAIAIAIFAVGTNLVADAVARSVGRSIDTARI